MAAPRLKPQLPAGATYAPQAAIDRLSALLSARASVAVLSGAGISTESGLSDYRSPGKARAPRPPINHHEFVTYPSVRRRYWARSFVGFPLLSRAAPSLAHHALAALHAAAPARFRAHVTQNVDGLLQRAGLPLPRLVELHGSVHAVDCRACRATEPRDRFQARLAAANRAWVAALADVEFRPDGDADLPPAAVARFAVPPCRACHADALMPALVFHGGAVPPAVADAAARAVDAADALLVVGSSVTPHSAFRLVRLAKRNGAFVACINFGPTRADHLYDCKVEALVGDAVARLAHIQLDGGFRPPDHIGCVLTRARNPHVSMLEL